MLPLRRGSRGSSRDHRRPHLRRSRDLHRRALSALLFSPPEAARRRRPSRRLLPRPHYPRHQEPAPQIPFKGSPGSVKAARWALASALRYAQLRDASVGLLTRLRARRLARKIRWNWPPWTGQGRYLDVGCGSGGTLGVAQALGWQVAGIEVDGLAPAKARRFAGVLKLFLEVTLPLALLARRGEVIRVGMRPK